LHYYEKWHSFPARFAGSEVTSDWQPISAARYMTAGSSIIPVGRGMDLSKLPIGSYRLDVQTTDSTGKSAAWRSANFTVEK